MKLKDIFSKDNMLSFAVGAAVAAGICVSAVAAVAVAAVAVALAVGAVGAGVAAGVAAGVGTLAAGVVAIAVAGAAAEKEFGLELKLVPSFAGVATAFSIAMAAVASNAPQACQELTAVSEPATVQMVQASGSAVDPLRISFTTTVDPDSAPANLSDNTEPVITAPAYELKMA